MKVVVMGAGATGLAAGYLLAKGGVEVTLVEASPRAGGLLSTFDTGQGDPLEYFYHHFFTHDTEINWLLGQLGLTEKVQFRKATMGMFRDGRLAPFNGIRDLLAFRAISLPARLRFGLSSAMLAYRKHYSDCEEIACLDWFERYAGRQATDAIWRPMLEIKFGDAGSRVPLAWMAGRLRQRVRSRKGGEEQLGYLDGSLCVLVDALVDALTGMGVTLRLGTAVESLVVEDGRVTGVKTADDTIAADVVISTVPTPSLAPLVRPIDAAYAESLDEIRYSAAICTVLALREPLSDTYWTNVADPGYDFGGVIEHTNLVPATKYGGQHLVYLSRYLDVEQPLWSMENEPLLARQLDQLGRMYGRDVGSLVERHWIFRGRYAAPVTDLGFHRRIPSMKSPIAGLFVGSMCHVYPDERSVNNSIRVAAEVVRSMGLEEAAESVPRGLSLAAKYGQ